MITNQVIVKYGAPVLSLAYSTLQLLYILTILINVLIIVYVFEIFNAAIRMKQTLGDYIDLLLEKGYVLSLIVGMSGLSCLVVSAFTLFVISKLFGAHKRTTMMLFVAVLCSLLLIVVLFIIMGLSLGHGYNTDTKYMNVMLTAMHNYSDDGLIKSKIDMLQMEFQCCGCRNYSDWFTIPWYDKNLAKPTETKISGEAPFSCCSIGTIFPCVHHGVNYGAGAYKYKPDANFSLSVKGCFEVISKKKIRASWTVVLYVLSLIGLEIVAFIPLRFLQTAHIERGKFDKLNHRYTAWLFGFYSGRNRSVQLPPPPVPPFESGAE